MEWVRLRLQVDIEGKKKKYIHLIEKSLFDRGNVKDLKKSISDKILRKSQRKRLLKMSFFVEDNFKVSDKESIHVIDPQTCFLYSLSCVFNFV